MKSRLDNREIIIQMWRTTKLLNMVQEFVHEVALFSALHRKVGDTIGKIPHLAFVTKHFKYTIAEDEQT